MAKSRECFYCDKIFEQCSNNGNGYCLDFVVRMSAQKAYEEWRKEQNHEIQKINESLSQR